MGNSQKLGMVILLSGLNLTSAFAMYGADAYNDNVGQFYGRLDFGYNLFNTPSATAASAFSPTSVTAHNVQVGSHIGYNLGIGYKYSEPFRSDVTLTYRPTAPLQLLNETSIGRGSLSNYTLMVNGYYTFQWNLPVDVYAMGGIGVSNNTTKNMTWSPTGALEYGQNNTNFAWQIGPGIAYQVNNVFFVDMNYQFVRLGPFGNSGIYSGIGQLPPTTWSSLYSNQLQLGARVFV